MIVYEDNKFLGRWSRGGRPDRGERDVRARRSHRSHRRSACSGDALFVGSRELVPSRRRSDRARDAQAGGFLRSHGPGLDSHHQESCRGRTRPPARSAHAQGPRRGCTASSASPRLAEGHASGSGENFTELRSIMRERGLHTVCEEASCPNIYECWEAREATFLLCRRSLHQALRLLRRDDRAAANPWIGRIQTRSPRPWR